MYINLNELIIMEIIEVSVKATHYFLSNKEILEIKKYVPKAINSVSHLIIVID